MCDVRGLEPNEPVDFDLGILYPNLAFKHETDDRAVLVHHGHYCESRYWLVSKLRRWLFPDRPAMLTIDELEGENFAWIEFVWSLLGRSGEAGEEVETLYKKLQYEKQADEFVDEVASRIAKATDIPMIPSDWLETKLLKLVFRRLGKMAGSERCHDHQCVSDEIGTGLRHYLFGPVFNQLSSELGRVPKDLSFVFGHTHKPFKQTIDDGPGGARIKLYNTGGWTVDSADPSHAYGASITLISADLQVSLLRTFNLGSGLELGVRADEPTALTPAAPAAPATTPMQNLARSPSISPSASACASQEGQPRRRRGQSSVHSSRVESSCDEIIYQSTF